MAEITRRGFLKQASVGAAAGVLAGGLVVAGSGLATAARRTGATASSHPGAAEPLVAHVRNVSTGEISLLVGTREVVYQDRELTSRLMTAAQQRQEGR